MQVNRIQSYNENSSFKALQPLRGVSAWNGLNIETQLFNKMEANELFRNLCNKYDVFVHVEPKTKIIGYTIKNDVAVKLVDDYGLSVDLFAKKIQNHKWPLISKKEDEILKIGSYFEPIRNVEKLQQTVNNIDANYISNKNGMEADIENFMKRVKRNYN